MGEEFPLLQEANRTAAEITNNTAKHRMESKNDMQEETKKQTAPIPWKQNSTGENTPPKSN
eukprot:5185242-Ditylum_brightwellii.AAC.1